MQTFAELPLNDVLQTNLAAADHVTPTEIQALALPAALAGRDLIACAQTGGGKTAVYALPILNTLERTNAVKPRALILVPTRELALQVEQSFALYGRGSGLRGVVLYGGAGMGQQVAKLRRGVDVVVATPGRLFDHMEQGNVDLSQVSILILDEADRLLDMGFLPQVKRIVDRVPSEGRQTMLFSATMDDAVEKLARAYLTDPEVVNAQPRSTAVPQIEQIVHRVTPAEKGDLLLNVLHEAREAGGSALVFTRTRHGADRLEKTLASAGVRSGCIHGDVAQNQRERVLSRFRAQHLDVLVATDVAARGIDVEHVTHVVNFDIPPDPEYYVHRIGRTGRVGRSGEALTLVNPYEQRELRNIERVTGARIERRQIPSIAEVAEREREVLAERIERCLQEGKWGPYRDVVEELANDHEPLDVAAAALALLGGGHRRALDDGEGQMDDLNFREPEPRREHFERRGRFRSGGEWRDRDDRRPVAAGAREGGPGRGFAERDRRGWEERGPGHRPRPSRTRPWRE